MMEKSKNLIDLVAGIIGIAFDRVQAGHNGDLASGAPADDLTQINGIGPAFASRLNEAGITTFADLANQSPEAIREAARITGGQADPAEWISEAGTLA